MFKLLPYVVALAVLVLADVRAADAPDLPSDSLSAEQILDRSAAAYRNLRTYEDTGTVVTRVDGNPAPLKALAFQTLFSQPGWLRFAYHDTGPGGLQTHHVLLIENGRATVRSSLTGEEASTKDAVSAVAEATGISDSAAYTLPAVLLPDVAWKVETWLSAPNANRVDDGVEQGIRCYRIQRRTSIDSNREPSAADTHNVAETMYWIAMGSALLLRVDRQVDMDGRKVAIVTRYIAKADSPVSASSFNLDWY
ncbi:MAG: hypothetical protein JO142_16320 [Burkholderiales bacterium]|nr:hypothetical protein [Burkholderiales bacterium]